MRRRRRYAPIGTRANPLGDNLALVGLGVITLFAVGIALYSTTASASTPMSWGVGQFSGGGTPGTPVSVGEYVLLQDAPSGKNIIVQVTSLGADGATAAGTVLYAPSAANESAGDTAIFNLASVLSSNAILQGLL